MFICFYSAIRKKLKFAFISPIADKGAYERYIATSGKLHAEANAEGKEALVLLLVKELSEAAITLMKETHPYFFMVDGPSGKGKTQLAIALAMMLRKMGTPAGWLLAQPIGSTPQPVYSTSRAITSGLLEASSYDEGTHPTLDGSVEDIKTATVELYLFGFVVELTKRLNRMHSRGDEGENTEYMDLYEGDDETVEIEPMTWQTAMGKLKNLTRGVVFIDEFPRLVLSRKSNVNKLRLLRNVFRALQVPVVVLGTDARISNMLAKDLSSRMHGERRLWCRLLLNFPSLVGMEEPSDEMRKSLAWRVWSRGRNAWVKMLGLEFLLKRDSTLSKDDGLSEEQVLLAVATYVRIKWQNAKPNFLDGPTAASSIAQMLVLSNSSLGSKHNTENGSDLVSNHMANATPERTRQHNEERNAAIEGMPFIDIFVKPNKYEVKCAKGVWGRLVWLKRFQTVREDPTTFLTAVAGDRFLLRDEMATCKLFTKVLEESSAVVFNSSGAAEKLSGNHLEYLACAAWVAATVGPNGHDLWHKSLSVVLANFFMHMTAVNAHTRDMRTMILTSGNQLQDGEKSDLLKHLIAVAEPVMIEGDNQETVSEFKMSRIVRMKDNKQTDAMIKTKKGMLLAVVECKNHKASVGSSILLESIEKGHDAPLRLLVCNTVVAPMPKTKKKLQNQGIRCLVVRARKEPHACWVLEPMNDEPNNTKITTVVVPMQTLRDELGDWVEDTGSRDTQSKKCTIM
jgi:hypothetical protein